MVETIKNHPVVFFLSAVVAAFGLGWGAHVQLQAARPTLTSQGTGTHIRTDVCGQVTALARQHNARIEQLTKLLTEEESEVASFGHIDEAHQRHVEAAQGYATAIKEENTSFQEQLSVLQKIACSEQ